MQTTITTQRGDKVSKHEISMLGMAGAILWITMVAVFLYVIAIATVGWQIVGGTVLGDAHEGLWESCTCTWYNTENTQNDQWRRAVQAMTTIGLLLGIVALVVCFIYIFIHRINKDTQLLVVGIFCILSVVFMFIGVVIYGAYAKTNLSYSYAFAVIGTILCGVAGVLSFLLLNRAKKSAPPNSSSQYVS